MMSLPSCDAVISHLITNTIIMFVHIASSKTDQYCQGDSVVVARTVSMLERYFNMGSPSQQSKLRLFQGIVVSKSGERLIRKGPSVILI